MQQAAALITALTHVQGATVTFVLALLFPIVEMGNKSTLGVST